MIARLDSAEHRFLARLWITLALAGPVLWLLVGSLFKHLSNRSLGEFGDRVIRELFLLDNAGSAELRRFAWAGGAIVFLAGLGYGALARNDRSTSSDSLFVRAFRQPFSVLVALVALSALWTSLGAMEWRPAAFFLSLLLLGGLLLGAHLPGQERWEWTWSERRWIQGAVFWCVIMVVYMSRGEENGAPEDLARSPPFPWVMAPFVGLLLAGANYAEYLILKHPDQEGMRRAELAVVQGFALAASLLIHVLLACPRPTPGVVAIQVDGRTDMLLQVGAFEDDQGEAMQHVWRDGVPHVVHGFPDELAPAPSAALSLQDSSAVLHMEYLAFLVLWAIVCQATAVWQNAGFLRGMPILWAWFRLASASVTRNHALQFLLVVLLVAMGMVASVEMSIADSDNRLNTVLAAFALDDYPQVVFAIWLAFASAHLTLLSNLVVGRDCALHAWKDFGRRWLGRMKGHVIVIGGSALARETQLDVTRQWLNDGRMAGSGRVRMTYVPLGSQAWQREELQSPTNVAHENQTLGRTPVVTSMLVVADSDEVLTLKEAVEIEPGLFFGFIFVPCPDHCPLSLKPVERRPSRLAVPAVCGAINDAELLTSIRFEEALLVVNANPRDDVSRRLLRKAVNPSTPGRKTAVIAAYDSYSNRGYDYPAALVSTSSVVFPRARYGLAFAQRVRHFALLATERKRSPKIALVCESEHIFQLLDLLRPQLERGFGRVSTDIPLPDANVSLWTFDQEFYARHAVDTCEPSVLKVHSAGSTPRKLPWPLPIHLVRDNLDGVEGILDSKPDVIAVALPSAQAREAARLLALNVDRRRLQPHVEDYAPFLVILGDRNCKVGVLRTLWDYDQRIVKRWPHSYTLGFVDAQREAADQIAAIAMTHLVPPEPGNGWQPISKEEPSATGATHMSNTSPAEQDAIEVTACLSEQPLSHARALRLLSGGPLEFEPKESDLGLDVSEVTSLTMPDSPYILARLNATQTPVPQGTRSESYPIRILRAAGSDAVVDGLHAVLLHNNHKTMLDAAIRDFAGGSSYCHDIDELERNEAHCPEVARCPIPIARTWLSNQARMEHRIPPAIGPENRLRTQLFKRVLSFRQFGEACPSHESLPHNSSKPWSALELILALDDGPNPGLLADILLMLSGQALAPHDSTKNTAVDLYASFTQPCDHSSYAFDKLYGRIVRKTESGAHESEPAKLTLSRLQKLDLVTLAPATHADDWKHWLGRLRTHFNGFLSNVDWKFYAFSVQVQKDREVSPGFALLVLAKLPLNPQPNALKEHVRTLANATGIRLERPAQDAGGRLGPNSDDDRHASLLWLLDCALHWRGQVVELP